MTWRYLLLALILGWIRSSYVSHEEGYGTLVDSE